MGFKVGDFLEENSLVESVLEVGFGPVFSHADSKKHAIIESHPENIEEALGWAEGQSHISIFQDSWKSVLPKLGVFDVIFYHSKVDDPKKEGKELFHQSQELISSVNEQIPNLKTIQYSDEDLESFYAQVGHLRQEDVARFLVELKEGGQITEKQYGDFIKKHPLEAPQKVSVKMVDPIFHFFEACKDSHMRPGSYFISFSSDFTSKYEDPQFFEHIITNPQFDYQEEVISNGGIIRIKKE